MSPTLETKRIAGIHAGGFDKFVRALFASPQKLDKRKARDLNHLHETTGGLWSGRVQLFGHVLLAGHDLLLPVDLRVKGLVWRAGQLHEHIGFTALLVVGCMYPLEAPQVRFLPPIPVSPHVVNTAHAQVAQGGLPPALQLFLEAGDGIACWAREGQWSATAEHTLAEVIWQTSRLVVMAACDFGEPPLNPAALAEAQRLRKQNRLPLETPLAYPAPPGGPRTAMPAQPDDDVEWLGQGGAP